MNNFSAYSLPEWLEFLENRHVEEIELGLQRARTAAETLDLLRLNSALIITVGGTNGKGSTVSALEAIYTSAGYCVGAYTSPHLLKFNERIRVNQQNICDESLCEAFTVIENSSTGSTLKYFETITLAALWYFKKKQCDVVILEVGMGGRFDATNIIDSDLAIITTVDLDHQQYLGTTKEAIGYTKAGILRHGKTFIYADLNPPHSVMEEALKQKNTIFCYGKDYVYSCSENQLHIRLHDKLLFSLPTPKLNLKAASAALLAAHQLSSLRPLNPQSISTAMETVFIKGRQQMLIKGGITTIYDVAHNPQAAQLLAEKIKKISPKGKVYAVFAALKDKDLYGLISGLSSCVDFWYPAILEGKRASSKAQLMDAFNTVLDLQPNCFDSPNAAYAIAKNKAGQDDLIIVYGSFLTVEAVMIHNECLKQQEEVA
jgi:dihydrofolate synthase/folylpolyglutamate synthase